MNMHIVDSKTSRMRGIGPAWLALVGLALAACSSNPTLDDSMAMAANTPVAQDDATLIVDCLLPGVVKKLGSSFTFLSPRRPIKTSALECEIRGGEYAAYDRANFETALKVWLPLAQQGDPQAQTYVGAIHEKGLGVPPNYFEAAHWYQKAADQGYAEAQFALGHLHELGLGVEKKPQIAYQLYRAASGLSENTLPTTEISLGVQQQVQLREALEQEQAKLAQVEHEIADKRLQLGSVESDLDRAQTRLAQRQKAVKEWDDKAQRAAARHRALQNELANSQLEASRLQQQLQAQQNALAATELAIARQPQAGDQKRQEPDPGPALNELRAQRDAMSAELKQLRAKRLALERDIARASTQQNNTAALRSESQAVEGAIATQLAQLSATEAALARQQALAASQGRSLNVLLTDMQQRKRALQSSLAELQNAQTALEQRRRSIEQERQRLNGDLSAEQQSLIADLSRQQDIIRHLQQTKRSNDNRIATLERAKTQHQVALVAPLIEILDPNLPTVRSAATTVPVLRLRSALQEREIVGKVTSETNLLLVTLNDQTMAISSTGVFKHKVPIRSADTLVDVVAVDQEGNRSQKKFVLALAAPSPAVDAAVERTVAVTPTIPDIEFGEYHALLIGNNEYHHLPDLLTPTRDVEAIKEVLLQRYKFKNVVTLTNATRYDIITQMNKLRRDLTEKDNLVIYYAGHGELDRVNLKGQWLPVDAEPQSTANWISNSALTELVNAIPAKHVLVVADSCYSGIMTRSALTNLEVGQSTKTRHTWLKKMVIKRSRTVLTSGGVAPVLDEGGGEHSIFAKAFLRVLRENNTVLEGQSLFRRVSAAVAVVADSFQVDQVPEYAPIQHAGHEAGDFFWVPRV